MVARNISALERSKMLTPGLETPLIVPGSVMLVASDKQARARRRSFTAQYKLDILAAYDAAGPGEKSAILRREALHSSHIVEWRRARDSGALAALARPRGRRAIDPRDATLARLLKEKTQLEQDLAKARFVVSVQAKAASALGEALRASRHGPEV